MVTIYDIAKQSNCSHMTVSRVINNTGKVSEATRARVKAVMEEMGYVPNTMARSLVKQETRILSLLIPDITNPFYTSLARGAEDAARRGGYRLLFSNSDENLAKEKEYVETVLSARVDGVLFAPASDQSAPQLKKLARHKMPFVLIDREVPGTKADTVLGDSRDGARRLTEHLIGLGHRRIALINSTSDVSTARLRMEGYTEALKLSDLKQDSNMMFETGYTRFNADEIIHHLLNPESSTGTRPTAVFAANNFIAIAVIHSLRKAGLQVPRDMSVVCFDDIAADYVFEPFLTSVIQPSYEFGSLGMQLLIERIEDQNRPPRSIILPSALEVRLSTAPPQS